MRPARQALVLALIFASRSTLVQAAEPSDSQPFLNPPKVLPYPGEKYAAKTRRFQGIPSLARSGKGRLWAIWYGGVGKGEDHHNYVIVVTSGDDGKTWSDEALVIDPDGDGPVRAFDPELWVDPHGRLWAFWAQAIGHDGTIGGVWCVTTDNPDDAKPTWSAPRRLTDGVMMCKPLVLSTGEWVLPASTWRKTDNSARMVVSTDEGKTWKVRGAAHVPQKLRNFDEHNIIERKDGTLWMLVRLAGGGIGESVSTDRGKTWTEVKRGDIPHVTARFFARRLASGNLLLVKHADKAKGRSRLTAYLSKNDGKSWTGGLLLDERSTVSYPDGVQADDGRIYIIYDRNRSSDRQIYMAVFTEEDVLAGRPVTDDVRLRVLVNQP
jgi:hypothetical protein